MDRHKNIKDASINQRDIETETKSKDINDNSIGNVFENEE